MSQIENWATAIDSGVLSICSDDQLQNRNAIIKTWNWFKRPIHFFSQTKKKTHKNHLHWLMLYFIFDKKKPSKHIRKNRKSVFIQLYFLNAFASSLLFLHFRFLLDTMVHVDFVWFWAPAPSFLFRYIPLLLHNNSDTYGVSKEQKSYMRRWKMWI